jgi:hypothetical protein
MSALDRSKAWIVKIIECERCPGMIDIPMSEPCSRIPAGWVDAVREWAPHCATASATEPPTKTPSKARSRRRAGTTISQEIGDWPGERSNSRAGSGLLSLIRENGTKCAADMERTIKITRRKPPI